MKIAIISDIHANYEALNSLSDIIESVDVILVLGDIIGYYCQVNEVISYLRKHKAICILGNHDYYLVQKEHTSYLSAVKFGINFADLIISDSNRKWLHNLPITRICQIDNLSFFLCHGSPWNPIHEYLYPDNPSIHRLHQLHYDSILFGHTHREYMSTNGNKIIINPGSVGQSRDTRTKSYACASIFNTQTKCNENIYRKYNVDTVIELGLKNGAGEWITKHLI